MIFSYLPLCWRLLLFTQINYSQSPVSQAKLFCNVKGKWNYKDDIVLWLGAMGAVDMDYYAT